MACQQINSYSAIVSNSTVIEIQPILLQKCLIWHSLCSKFSANQGWLNLFKVVWHIKGHIKLCTKTISMVNSYEQLIKFVGHMRPSTPLVRPPMVQIEGYFAQNNAKKFWWSLGSHILEATRIISFKFWKWKADVRCDFGKIGSIAFVLWRLKIPKGLINNILVSQCLTTWPHDTWLHVLIYQMYIILLCQELIIRERTLDYVLIVIVYKLYMTLWPYSYNCIIPWAIIQCWWRNWISTTSISSQ